MSSKNAFNRLLRKGYPVDRCPYNSNDSLEANEDLSLLAEVLNEVKDSNSKPAKFTINNVMANPNFDKIKESDFSKYYYEPFYKTLEADPKSDNVISIYRQGLEEGVFTIQFHGREHIHVNNWLAALNKKDRLFLDAFDEKMFTTHGGKHSSCRRECLDAMATYSESDFKFVTEAVSDGLQLFEETWGFKSKSLIAPCYTWSSSLEHYFLENGIKFIQGGRVQKEPNAINERFTLKRKYMGMKNKLLQFYFIRNVSFEPAENLRKDWVSSALKEIETAFFHRKPAIISSHRLNFIGRLNPENRERNLKLLKKLLSSIVKEWPEVEFMGSDDLGELVSN